jgi:histidine triad (HIT) family protein
MNPDCIFCRIIRQEMPAKIVHQDEQVIAFDDINPQAPTHVLVVPRKHIAGLNDLAEEDLPLVGHIHRVAAEVARGRGVAESGYRTLFNTGRGAGQSVFHLHLHLLGGRGMRWPPG